MMLNDGFSAMTHLENQLYVPDSLGVDQIRSESLVRGLAFGICVGGIVWVTIASLVIWALS